MTEAAFVENENTFGTATVMLALFGTTVVRPLQSLEAEFEAFEFEDESVTSSIAAGSRWLHQSRL